jgi:hypothetical protein
MDYCIALREGETVLYSILSKIISEVPDSTVNAALTYYSSETPASGVASFLTGNPVAVALAALSIVLLAVIVILLFRFSPRKNKA